MRKRMCVLVMIGVFLAAPTWAASQELDRERGPGVWWTAALEMAEKFGAWLGLTDSAPPLPEPTSIQGQEKCGSGLDPYGNCRP